MVSPTHWEFYAFIIVLWKKRIKSEKCILSTTKELWDMMYFVFLASELAIFLLSTPI